ncbi:leucine-rich repeat domain-containing protein [Pinibacter soli]|uniref:Leucine-rich repeat domain-containing protein n=1 Tax=Pinibacter soli TaxID=3044211 RepID=A0ABT6RIR8_9BACT|nr:leucine-rich repeat domain-containing protein [Pinibacter soli]MDI3321737.1 leucine-rich repeat domain-containing protein [Pinibacter soli]
MNKITSLLIAIISTSIIFFSCKKFNINSPQDPPYAPLADHSITMQLAQLAQVGSFTSSNKGDFSVATPAFNLNGKNIKVSWGDGVDSLYPGGSGVTVVAYHTYPRLGDYTVTITGDSLSALDCTGNRNMNTSTSWYNPSNSFMEAGVGHIVSLYITKVPEMTSLNCSYNDIQVLSTSVAELPNLSNLVCSHNYRVGLLPLTNCTKLTNVDCSSTSISKLDVSNCPLLTNLACNEPTNGGKSLWGGINLRSLKLNNPVLTKINCSNNQIDSLDVTQCPALTSLDCSTNYALVYLKLNNPNLTTLSCGGGSANFGGPSNLTSVDFSQTPALTSLTYAYTNAQTLPASIATLTNLTTLSCTNNALTSLPDLTALTKLATLKFSFNFITSVDASKLPNATPASGSYFLYLDNNALTSFTLPWTPTAATFRLYLLTNPFDDAAGISGAAVDLSQCKKTTYTVDVSSSSTSGSKFKTVNASTLSTALTLFKDAGVNLVKK